MATVMERGEEAPVTTAGPAVVRPARLTTTLYDLMAVLQDVVGPEDDTLVVATMVHLLRAGRFTGLGKGASGPGATTRATGTASHLPTGHRVEN
jgi:hypothetical protein